MARAIEHFNAPKPPKIYEGHFPELVIHALNSLNASGIDRASILESINTFNLLYVDNTHWMVIYQLSNEDVHAGTFTPGRITQGVNGYQCVEPLSYPARALLTKAHYLNGKGLGCYVIRPYQDTLVSIPYSLEEVSEIPELAVAMFALHDAHKLHWLNCQQPMYDVYINDQETIWFGFTADAMNGVADFSAWRKDGNRYNAEILLGQALFIISIDCHRDGTYGVLIHMYDYRPRLTNTTDFLYRGVKDEPYHMELVNVLGPNDGFAISFTREFGGDITVRKDYPNFRFTAEAELKGE